MRRNTRKPLAPHRDPLTRLADSTLEELAAKGCLHLPAAPWLTAGHTLVVTAQGCGWERDTTPAQMVERVLGSRGWACRWEGEELVLEIPGWTPPPPRVVATQPGLFTD